MSQEKVRVRVAPSPTGDPHLGLAYITLFNYAFASKHGGDLILRIEDTDRSRYKSSSEAKMIKCLKWLGLNWQEGPDVGGDLGPYRQSERTDIYKKHIDQLLDKKAAYHCFCSAERLDEMRTSQRKKGTRLGYDRLCRSLSKETVAKNLQKGLSSVVRFKMPTEGKSVFHDVLRKKIEIDYSQLDDQVLLKSDGFPTYHLASVVDDHLMKISHVIRAEEWISSTPKHVALYEAFAWEQPKFVHLPLLRNNDRSKISKRKNPTSIELYQYKGILPQAMINFLALMGWAYDDKTEIFSLEQMVKRFKIEDIHLGGPVFDQQKLLWLNQHYIKELAKDSFVSHMRDQVFSANYLEKLYPLVRDRLESFDQFVDKFAFFFSGELVYDNLAIVPKTKTSKEMKDMFKDLLIILDEMEDWEENFLQDALANYLKKLNWKPKEFYMPIRFVTTGRKDSPPLVPTLVVLGREMVRYRIQSVLKSDIMT